jgi:acyl-homoserine lactone acylase PvdQ
MVLLWLQQNSFRKCYSLHQSHTTFYFRPEIQMSSEEGLNAYGAVTWGNFFIYQGFNENCGWMHTSTNVDVADMYAEKIVTKNDKLFYEYNSNYLSLKNQYR